MKTPEQINIETKLKTLNYTAFGLSAIGSVAGVAIATRMGKGLGGKILGFFLGGMALGTPYQLITMKKKQELKGELEKMGVDPDALTSNYFTGKK